MIHDSIVNLGLIRIITAATRKPERSLNDNRQFDYTIACRRNKNTGHSGETMSTDINGTVKLFARVVKIDAFVFA